MSIPALSYEVLYSVLSLLGEWLSSSVVVDSSLAHSLLRVVQVTLRAVLCPVVGFSHSVCLLVVAPSTWRAEINPYSEFVKAFDFSFRLQFRFCMSTLIKPKIREHSTCLPVIWVPD